MITVSGLSRTAAGAIVRPTMLPMVAITWHASASTCFAAAQRGDVVVQSGKVRKEVAVAERGPATDRIIDDDANLATTHVLVDLHRYRFQFGGGLFPVQNQIYGGVRFILDREQEEEERRSCNRTCFPDTTLDITTTPCSRSTKSVNATSNPMILSLSTR